MTPSLLKKVWRDFSYNKKNLIPIVIILVLGISITITLILTKSNLLQLENKMEQATNCADIYIDINDFSLELLKKIQDIKGIQTISTREITETIIKGESTQYIRVIKNNGELNMPIIFSGNEKLHFGEGLINQSFIRLQDNLNIGDKITIYTGGNKKNPIDIKITGSFNTPEYIQGPHKDFIRADYGVIIVDKNTFHQISKGEYFSTQILVKVAEGASLNQVVSKILQNISKEQIKKIEIWSENHGYITFHNMLISQVLTNYRNVFLVFILLVCFITSIITIVRLINRENATIGILKIMGYSKYQIMLQYIFLGIFLSTISNILGSALGVLFSKYITAFYVNIFDLYLYDFNTQFYLIIPIILLVYIVMIFATLIASLRSIRIPPISSVKKIEILKVRVTLLERIPRFWNILSQPTKNIVRILFRQPFRIFGGIFITFMCCILTLTMLTFITINKNVYILEKEFSHYDLEVVLSHNAQDKMYQQLDKNNYIANYQMSDKVSGKLLYETFDEEVEFVVTNNENNSYHMVSPRKEILYLSEEGVIISSSLARLMSIKEGDLIEIQLYGTNIEILVSNIFEYFQPIVMVPANIIEKVTNSPIQYRNVQINLTDLESSTKQNISETLNQFDNVVGVNFQEDVLQKIVTGYQLTNIIMYIIMGIIIILDIYVLLTISRIFYVENIVDMAILRMNGLNKYYIASLINSSQFLITISSIFLIGISSKYFVQILMDLLEGGRIFEIAIKTMDMAVVISGLIIMMGVLFIQNVIKIKNMDIPSIIKEM